MRRVTSPQRFELRGLTRDDLVSPVTAAVSASTPGVKCFLVGAGLGPIEYLTLKAADLIKIADVIIYDDLGAGDAVLQLASPNSRKIYVGKRGGKAGSMKQHQIDEILVEECLKAKASGSSPQHPPPPPSTAIKTATTTSIIVRLKGGDPAVFSRVSSEITALRAAEIPYELVPGVSSALAAPLLAGFPLTNATIGTSFAVTTGHDVEGTDWGAFAGVQTLVILMAGRNLPRLVEKLLGEAPAGGSCEEAVTGVHDGKAPGQQGTEDAMMEGEPSLTVAMGDGSRGPRVPRVPPRGGHTPVVVVRDAGLPEQTIWRSTLDEIVADTEGESLSPCVVIVGEVAGLYI